MSGLYLLVVLVIWVALTWMVFKQSSRALGKFIKQPVAQSAAWTVLAALWLGTSFWYSGGRKFYYDAQVEAMCAKDGGIKVYETVKLPAERFDKHGAIRIRSKQDAKPSDGYYYEWAVHHYLKSNPSMRRDHFKIIRMADGKLLGEETSYARRGGDMPSLLHESSFRCPENAGDQELVQRVFTK